MQQKYREKYQQLLKKSFQSITQMSLYSFDDNDDDDEPIITVIISWIKNADIFGCSVSLMGKWLNQVNKWWKIF